MVEVVGVLVVGQQHRIDLAQPGERLGGTGRLDERLHGALVLPGGIKREIHDDA
ncbi:hypothetical protein [Actinomadura coerulea]|uniref:hypothetical protein n=1 Tax=Actinomadura coerulea TaxID=46159 RepID=UPI0034329615